MNKLNLISLLITGAALHCTPVMAQQRSSTAIEKEMMGNRIGKIQAATVEILKGKNFLTVVDAGEQLKNTAAAVVPIAYIKPYNKALSKSAIYKRLRQSTVVFATGSTHGTGYVIDASGIIVTNRHILGSYADTVHHNQVMLVTDYAGKVYPVVQILSNSFINDLVVVKIDTGGDLFTPLPLGGRMEEGDDVFILGHPGEMPYYFSAGMVNRVLIRNTSSSYPVCCIISCTIFNFSAMPLSWHCWWKNLPGIGYLYTLSAIILTTL